MNGGLKNIVKAGMVIFALKKTEGRKCDAEELSPTKEAYISRHIDLKNDWIVDSGSEGHITGNVEKLQNFSAYEGPLIVFNTHLERLPIAHVGSAIVSLNSNDKLPLQQVYHVPGSPNLVSVSQLTSSGYFVLSGPEDVKLYRKLDISDEPVMKGVMSESIYLIPED